MNIRIQNQLFIEQPPEALQITLKKTLTMSNPKWLENDRMGRWNGKTPKLLSYYSYDKMSDVAIIPRGFINRLLALCNHDLIPYSITDLTRSLPKHLLVFKADENKREAIETIMATKIEPGATVVLPPGIEVDIKHPFQFNATLKPFQEEAGEACLFNRFGVLVAPTGSGKTVIALWMIAQRGQPTLIVVHTKELQKQWVDRITQFLGISSENIGLIGGGKHKIKPITVALVQSLYKCAAEVSVYFGYLIVDECHRTPSRTFTEAVKAFDSRYMLGLSATPWRRDKLHKLIFWHLGDTLYDVEKKKLIDSGDILSADLIVRPTGFSPEADPTAEYSKMLSEITKSLERNRLIAQDIASESRKGSCIVLSDRKAHCWTIKDLLRSEHGIESRVLTGDLNNTERLKIIEAVQAGHLKVLIATGQLIGEGFDCKRLSTLFFATPIKFDGRVIQYLGRILRPAEGKHPRVYDYVDPVGVLINSFKERRKAYRKCGIKLDPLYL